MRSCAQVICNLQRTPLDAKADFVIHAKTDVVMQALMRELGSSLFLFSLCLCVLSDWLIAMPIPPFVLRRRVVLHSEPSTVTAGQYNLSVMGVDSDGIAATSSAPFVPVLLISV
jgi:hypothetical protein